ncbi:MAG TPA: MFS transporter [Polyangiaceae bacterium]|nr:MFS transporter [Polyangiaceae bacterium]
MPRFLPRISDRNIVRVYAASFALGLAYGIAVSLIAVYLDARGFEKQAIGSLAAWFALGLVSFAWPMGALIRRFSAKAALVVSLGGYALSVGALPFLETFEALALARFIDGACSVGVWISCETLLLSRSAADQKAYVTSLYAITLAFGYVAGPILARGLVAVAPLPAAFLAAACIALVAAVYVALRLDSSEPGGSHASPELHASRTHVSLLAILSRIKTSCFGTFAYGYFQASVVLFLPLFLMESKGIAREQTIILPAFFALGMLLFASTAGKLGDRYGHLSTMRVLAVVGATMIASFVLLNSFYAMCVAVFVAGATLASISPISLALQGVVTEPDNISRATSLYNAFYAAGMLLGPPASSRIFARWGGGPMLGHLAALWLTFVAFAWFFRNDDPAARRFKWPPPSAPLALESSSLADSGTPPA